MTDENSLQGAGDKDQDLDIERSVAAAPETDDVPAGGSEPVPGGPPPADVPAGGSEPVPGGPPPADVPAGGSEPVPGGPPPTGDERVDAAVAGLSRLQGRPAEEHVAVLEEVHGRLRDLLDDLGPEQR